MVLTHKHWILDPHLCSHIYRSLLEIRELRRMLQLMIWPACLRRARKSLHRKSWTMPTQGLTETCLLWHVWTTTYIRDFIRWKDPVSCSNRSTSIFVLVGVRKTPFIDWVAMEGIHFAFDLFATQYHNAPPDTEMISACCFGYRYWFLERKPIFFVLLCYIFLGRQWNPLIWQHVWLHHYF